MWSTSVKVAAQGPAIMLTPHAQDKLSQLYFLTNSELQCMVSFRSIQGCIVDAFYSHMAVSQDYY
jgi:hypothetical protein